MAFEVIHKESLCFFISFVATNRAVLRQNEGGTRKTVAKESFFLLNLLKTYWQELQILRFAYHEGMATNDAHSHNAPCRCQPPLLPPY